MRRMSFEDKPPSSSAGNGGWGRQGWMDGQGDTAEEKRRGRAERGVIQEESCCSRRADHSPEFCLWANLLL